MISSEQCRAARGLLGLSQTQLASDAGLNKRTLLDFENGKRQPNPATLAVIESILTGAGVVLIPENGGGAGVRLRDPGGAR